MSMEKPSSVGGSLHLYLVSIPRPNLIRLNAAQWKQDAARLNAVEVATVPGKFGGRRFE